MNGSIQRNPTWQENNYSLFQIPEIVRRSLASRSGFPRSLVVPRLAQIQISSPSPHQHRNSGFWNKTKFLFEIRPVVLGSAHWGECSVRIHRTQTPATHRQQVRSPGGAPWRTQPIAIVDTRTTFAKFLVQRRYLICFVQQKWLHLRIMHHSASSRLLYC